MSNIIELKCPSCGVQMKFHNKKRDVFKCPYCNCRIMLGNQVNHHNTTKNNYIRTRNIPVADSTNVNTLWKKYDKLINLQEDSAAMKVLDQIFEDDPYDVKALKEKIRIADLCFDKGEVLSKFIAGEGIEKVALYYVMILLAKECRHLRMLTSNEETLESIRGSCIWSKIEAINKYSQDKQSEIFGWNDLPTGYFFRIVGHHEKVSSTEWSDWSGYNSFCSYLDNAYSGAGGLDSHMKLMLLSDRQTLIIMVDNSCFENTNLLEFSIQGRELVAPRIIRVGKFRDKPSLFNPRFEFWQYRTIPIKHSCNIKLSHFRDGDVYALTFGSNDVVFFTITGERFKETHNRITYNSNMKGTPNTFKRG